MLASYENLQSGTRCVCCAIACLQAEQTLRYLV